MDERRTTTPERRPPRWGEFELASFGTRLAAFLIDGFIVSAIVALARALAGRPALGPQNVATGEVALSLAIAAAVGAAYFLPQMVQRNGQTVGKRALRIRVVRVSQQPMDVWTALLREVLCKELAFGLALVALAVPNVAYVALLDYLWVLWDPQYRALHDFAARTRVVRVPH